LLGLLSTVCSSHRTQSCSLATMAKTVMSSMTVAMVVANDVSSLLQLSAGVRQSQAQHILAAIAEQGKDTICVQAAAGDVAPVTGSFTASMSQQAVVVAAGSVAGEAGSFCASKQDVLLIQRTFGLNTARDIEAAVGSKHNKATTTTTTTVMNWETFDFEGNLTKVVTVKAGECSNVQAGLVQTVESSVSDKQMEKKLDADQLRVCGCRNYLNNPKLMAKTTTTTTMGNNPNFQTLAFGCSSLTTAFDGNWTRVAKEINNPRHRAFDQEKNVTGGWEHCDKSWVVQAACGVVVLEDLR